MKISNTPPKGTADWFPEEYKTRKYIFDTWRKVCLSYGFEEYLGPLVESVDIWKAKSGEDVGGSELTQITNRDGELDGLAIRPEMTPTVTRMVTRKYKEVEKPIKWFSIANFYRNEKPQKGRNREFWQLNADIFGESSSNADIEILTLALELMRAFEAPRESYTLKLNHRGLIEDFFTIVLEIDSEEDKTSLMRLLDKYSKLSSADFEKALEKLGLKNRKQIIDTFMTVGSVEELGNEFLRLTQSENFKIFEEIYTTLGKLGYNTEISFSGDLIRGFDYYDGIIFEMFDTNSDNPRALFGGGRYNGLASIFGMKEEIPAVGFAPGDETMKLFLEGHKLLDGVIDIQEERYYLPLLDEGYFEDISRIAQVMRAEGKNITLGLSTKKIPKALKYAEKNNFSHIVIYSEQEKTDNNYKIENLTTGEYGTVSL